MADVINTNVFNSGKKFVDLSGLDYFWGKAKTYIDGVDATMSAKVVANENAIKEINDELNSLSGGAGSIGTQIDNKIDALDLPNTYDAKGSADAVSSVLTEHKNDTTAHITADERTAWNDAKEAIDVFLKDADMTESAVDTLKELQTYMTNDGAAATELVNRVADLEKIDHEAYIAADETILASAKSYVDGKVDDKFDTVGAAATALTDAKAYADSLAGNYDAKGSAATAKTEAIAQAKVDATEALKAYYTKTEVDNLLSTNSTGDRAYAKQYTDELFNSFKFAANSDIDALFA